MRSLVLALLLLAPAVAQDTPADFTLRDTNRDPWRLSNAGRPVVLVWLGVECPMANRSLLRLADLAKKYPGVAFAGVNSNANESEEAIAKHAIEASLPFPVLVDPDAKVADQFKVTTVPTAIVLDAARTVRYRGRIDDHKSEDLVKKRYLKDAIEAVLAGKDAPLAETVAVGCAIQRRVAEKPSEVTYASHVAKILNDNCVACHRPGQVAPFSLIGYDQAKRWARESARHAKAGNMPPWKPANEGMFRGERRLSKDEIAMLATWAEAGAPRGDATREPAPPRFTDGWMLGEPDLVLEPTAEYDVAPEGADEYRCFVLDPKLTEDRYVTAVEFRPGNSRIVHHLMTYIDAKGDSLAFDARDDGLGYSSTGTGPGFMPLGDLGGWGPGMQPSRLDEGTGYYLPAGARIVMEAHYHKNGRKEKDRSKIGLHFAKGPIKKRVRSHVILNMSFLIPAGAKRHKVSATWTVREDIHAVAVIPHMHLLGKEIEVTATYPDGTKLSLVHIQEWDFNWQETYQYRKPVALPAGTKVQVVGLFDNSSENPNQPRAQPRAVSFGEETTDEMCVAYIAFTKDKE